MRKFLVAILIFIASNASAQEISPEVDKGIASIKQKKLMFSAETRIFDSSPEFIFKHKNFSVDYINSEDGVHFGKLKFDKEIFSLMGTGLEWNVALNAVDTRKSFYMLPSVGINFYMRIRPRLDIYTQFSGLTLGGLGYVKDFESGLRYFPQKNLSISAGWRRIDFKSRRSSTTGKFFSDGFFAGIRYDF